MDAVFNLNHYPTYNVGDRVTIRQWDDMAAEFGLNRYGAIKVPQVLFTEPMKQYCGQTLPIVRIDPYSPSSFDFYYLGGSRTVFTSIMFEQSYPTVVSSTLSFDDLLKGATAQLANPQP